MTINNSDDCISHGTVLVPEGIKARYQLSKSQNIPGDVPRPSLRRCNTVCLHCSPSRRASFRCGSAYSMQTSAGSTDGFWADIGCYPISVLASIPELAPGHGQPQSALSTPIREGRRTRARSSRTVQRRRVSGRTDVIIDEDPRGMAPLFPHHLDPRFLRCGLSGTA